MAQVETLTAWWHTAISCDSFLHFWTLHLKSAYYCEKRVTKPYAKNLHKFEFINTGKNESQWWKFFGKICIHQITQKQRCNCDVGAFRAIWLHGSGVTNLAVLCTSAFQKWYKTWLVKMQNCPSKAAVVKHNKSVNYNKTNTNMRINITLSLELWKKNSMFYWILHK